MAEMVSCSRCANFTPDKIGSGLGIGKCKPFEDYAALKPSARALEKAFKKLGGKLFYKGSDDRDDRVCEKFEGLANG